MSTAVIDHWSERQRAALREEIETLGRKALRTDSIDGERALQAISVLYAELGLNPPAQYLYFSSPAAAFADFERWAMHTGRVLVNLWNYQLPPFSPHSYWRTTHRDGLVDLAIRRRPNEHGCWAYGEPISEAEGALLGREVHRQMWTCAESIALPNWCDEMIEELQVGYPKEFYALDEQLRAEDPTLQATIDEFVFLGPLPWLLREVGCARVAASCLGCRTNIVLYRALHELLEFGSLVLTFENLCVLCERPSRCSSKKAQFVTGQAG